MNKTRFLGLAALAIGLSAAAAGSEEICDPGLLGSDRSPMAYQLRGDRCEGIYKLEVNSELLRLVSIVESFEGFDTGRPEDLTVEWSAPPELTAQTLRLRAIGLGRRSFYRMDTALAARAKSFSWPLDILDHNRLAKEDLGIRGWIPHPQPPDKDFTEIYLPLRLWQSGGPVRKRSYEIAFIPEVKLKEVFVSVAEVDARARRQGAPVVEKRPLEYGYYPAKEPVYFEISGIGHSGYRQVDLLALDSIGGSMTYRFLLYCEEPPQ